MCVRLNCTHFMHYLSLETYDTIYRGFRQATRGPDTGAFHHPLFQRNKPELCLEMVCQRSRDRRNLPAKKRQIAALTKESLDTFNGANLQQQQQQTALLMTTPQLLQHPTVSVSGDSQSSISTNSATSSTLIKVVPGITSDTTLTQRALRQRNEEERMRVAKSMLYHAYLEAIQQKGSSASGV